MRVLESEAAYQLISFQGSFPIVPRIYRAAPRLTTAREASVVPLLSQRELPVTLKRIHHHGLVLTSRKIPKIIPWG